MRAELLGKLVAAQFEIQSALTELVSNAAAVGECQAQLQILSALQRQIGSASHTALAGMRSEIIAVASATQAIAQQSRASANSSDAATNLAEVTSKTRRTIQNVTDELFEQKKLDPYLQFASAEDEAEYRKREAARKAYIDAELAKGTPQGALNATNATISQLEDARTHGADQSPDFARLYGAATDAGNAQRMAMEQAASKAVPSQPDETPPPSVNAPASNLDEIVATLRAAGVAVPDLKSAPQNAHGLSETASAEAPAISRNG